MSRPIGACVAVLLCAGPFLMASAGGAPGPDAAQEFWAGDSFRVGTAGLELPVLKRVVLPDGAEGSEGTPYRQVEVEVVVQKNGRVRVLRVVRSVDKSRGGLDRQAVEAIRQWEFEAGGRNGKPEAVRLVCVVGFGDRRTLATGRTSSPREGDEAFAPGAVPAFGTPGVTPPAVRVRHDPPFPAAALRLRAPREVDVQVVVTADGSVGAARVVKSLEPTSDALALVTARAWVFEPATRAGQPVPVTLIVGFSFDSR